jgi:hypothetical protein
MPDKLIAMLNLSPVRWDIDDDAAWARLGMGCYRHYSGASLIQKGKLWNAISSDGDLTRGHKTAWDALECLEKTGLCRLSRWEDFTREYGPVRHLCSPVSKDEPMYFVFWAAPDEEFPSIVKSALAREFFGKATCAGCLAPMVSFQTRIVHRFEGPEEIGRTYFACACGAPVWRMPWEQYDPASTVMENNAKSYHRKLMLAEAGGTHRKQDIRDILAKQKGRCIYCNRRFGPELIATKDHLLALTAGGGGWPLNIVLACRSCNSSRCDLPFRTYCRMLSPAQNRRILVHLVERLRGLTDDEVTRRGLGCFDYAMSLHDTKSFRYGMMKNETAARRNLQVNKTSAQQRDRTSDGLYRNPAKRSERTPCCPSVTQSAVSAKPLPPAGSERPFVRLT